MPRDIRRIAILTGGGDCPGLNAVIRAVAKDAMFHGMEVLGIEDGFLGLIEDRVRPLRVEDVSGILTVGGPILGSSNKANPQKFAVGRNPDGSVIWKDVTDVCVKHLQERGVDVLIAIGGDGTMACAEPMIRMGVPCVGVPKTIDNDLWGTELTFGFQTAVQIASDAIDRVQTTAASHHRAMVVEVMGRNAGWIGLYAGLASASDVILLPEQPFDLEKVCEVVRRRGSRGSRFTVICCAEGAYPRDGERVVERVDPTSPDPIRLGGISRWLSAEIEKRTGIESRYVVLGHVQRGGSPVSQDRVLATLFGDHAMELLKEGRLNRLVAWQNGRLTDVDMRESAGRQRLVTPDNPVVEAARSVGTSFGD